MHLHILSNYITAVDDYLLHNKFVFLNTMITYELQAVAITQTASPDLINKYSPHFAFRSPDSINKYTQETP